MSSDFRLLSIIEKKELAKDTFSFTFSTEGKDFSFTSGQYVSLILRIDGKIDTRDFSIASSPFQKDSIMIVTKKGTSKFKKKLFDLESRSKVRISFPSGGFISDIKDAIPQVFIAGGIGITPFYSLLSSPKDKKMLKPVTLFVSFSKIEDILFYNELMKVQNLFEDINIIYTVSSPDSKWNGEKGRISKDLIKKYVPNFLQPNYYIVGKVEMVDDMQEILNSMKVPNEKVKIEYFTGY